MAPSTTRSLPWRHPPGHCLPTEPPFYSTCSTSGSHVSHQIEQAVPFHAPSYRSSRRPWASATSCAWPLLFLGSSRAPPAFQPSPSSGAATTSPCCMLTARHCRHGAPADQRDQLPAPPTEAHLYFSPSQHGPCSTDASHVLKEIPQQSSHPLHCQAKYT
ncbi:hypothetical protein BS78_08G082700 [Paspalum vaginatum]|nr:hypothetical protein BS78_08G082700 [Paspalum vaginatum]